jgi:hypothetical protein
LDGRRVRWTGGVFSTIVARSGVCIVQPSQRETPSLMDTKKNPAWLARRSEREPVHASRLRHDRDASINQYRTHAEVANCATAADGRHSREPMATKKPTSPAAGRTRSHRSPTPKAKRGQPRSKPAGKPAPTKKPVAAKKPAVAKTPAAAARKRTAARTGTPLANAMARLRAICLGFPEAHEVEAWGEPTFRVTNKIFAMHSSASTHHGAGREGVWINSDQFTQDMLVRAKPDRYFRPPYVGTSGWVGAWLDGKPDWNEIGELLRDAYIKRAPKKIAARLDHE